MAKIGLTKLGLKKNSNLLTFSWNEQVIEVKEYLPVEEKLKVVERIVNQSLDDNNFANPARIMINTVLEVIFAYTTNINFTDKQKEDIGKLYDLLEENQDLKTEVRNLKSSIEAAKLGEKEITNVDLLRRISQLEKIILGKEQQ